MILLRISGSSFRAICPGKELPRPVSLPISRIVCRQNHKEFFHSSETSLYWLYCYERKEKRSLNRKGNPLKGGIAFWVKGIVVKLRDKNRASCLPFSAVRAAEKEPGSRARVIIACFRFPANGN